MDEQKARAAIEKAKQDLAEVEAALTDGPNVPPPTPQANVPPPVAPAAPVAAAPAEPVAAAPVAEPAPVVAPVAAAAPAATSGIPTPGNGKWVITFERDNCIGAGACVAANADYWSIAEDGKADFNHAVFDSAKNLWVLEVDESGLQKQRDAAEVCPVTVIHIYDPQGNQEI